MLPLTRITLLCLSTAALAGCGSTPRQADTTTQLRCYYRVSADPTDSRTSHYIAQQDSKPYALPGYWRRPVAPGLNMFYTDVPRKDVVQICADTLQAQGIAPGSTFTFLSAAPSVVSLDYEIWHNDPALKASGDIDRVVVFGDSLSDINNVFNLTRYVVFPERGGLIRGPAPNASSWLRGRFSNGPLWHEYVSGAANVPSHNWALGGAQIDLAYFPAFGEQIRSYRDYARHTKNYNIANTLFMVFFGANDIIFGNRDIQDVLRALENDLTLLSDTDIHDKRLQNVLIANIPDLSNIPFIKRNPERAARVKQEVDAFNQELPKIVTRVAQRYRDKYGQTLNIQIFDSFDLLNDVLNNPGKYGIVNTTDSCLIFDPTQSGAKAFTSAHAVEKECQRSQGSYLFWDILHPTLKLHRIIGGGALDVARKHFPLPKR